MAIGGKDANMAAQFPTHNAPRVWLITAGDSAAGISLARQVLSHGDHVVSAVPPSDYEGVEENDHDEEAGYSEGFRGLLVDVRAQIGSGWRNRLKVLPLDIRIMRLCQVAVAEVVKSFGRIDILLCCTSKTVVGTVEELAASKHTQALVREQFETNYFGPINIIKAALPTMRQQKIGHMIMLGSITGHLGTPGLGIHCAANWALEGFCDSIAYEIAPFNIKMTILQANLEVDVLLNPITIAPAHPAYSPKSTNAPLFRGVLNSILNNLPRFKAQQAYMKQDQRSTSPQLDPSTDSILLNLKSDASLRAPLSQAHAERLLAETVHALTAIGGHENPPARHVVGAEGVASVKEKLKTVSEELEDFLDASSAVDVSGPSSSGTTTETTERDNDGGAPDPGSGGVVDE